MEHYNFEKLIRPTAVFSSN